MQERHASVQFSAVFPENLCVILILMFFKIEQEVPVKNKKALPGLFRDFFKFGCFTFGGGWSIVAQMQELYVEKRHTLTDEELLDLTSVGRSLPGTMIGNIAVLYGSRIAGYAGGVTALFAMVLAPFLILSVIAGFYQLFQSNPVVADAMMGVRASVVPIIACAALRMVKGAYRFPPCIFVTIACAVLYIFFDVSCVWLVIFGAVSGFLITALYERNGGTMS